MDGKKGHQNIANKIEQEEKELNKDESFTKSLFFIELEREKNLREDNFLLDDSFIDDNISDTSTVFEKKKEVASPKIETLSNQDFILNEELYQPEKETEVSNSLFIPTEELETESPVNSSQSTSNLELNNNLKVQDEIFRPE